MFGLVLYAINAVHVAMHYTPHHLPGTIRDIVASALNSLIDSANRPDKAPERSEMTGYQSTLRQPLGAAQATELNRVPERQKKLMPVPGELELEHGVYIIFPSNGTLEDIDHEISIERKKE